MPVESASSEVVSAVRKRTWDSRTAKPVDGMMRLVGTMDLVHTLSFVVTAALLRVLAVTAKLRSATVGKVLIALMMLYQVSFWECAFLTTGRERSAWVVCSTAATHACSARIYKGYVYKAYFALHFA